VPFRSFSLRGRLPATVIGLLSLGVFTSGAASAAYGFAGGSPQRAGPPAPVIHRTVQAQRGGTTSTLASAARSARTASPRPRAETAGAGAPRPSASPHVAPMGHLHEADLIVRSDKPLSHHVRSRVSHWHGVHASVPADVGKIHVGKATGEVMGVDPSTFRPFTPKLTARSDKLWQSVARGELTVSFDMGKNAKLPLGKSVSAGAADRVRVRLGAFATVGLAGVDAIVSDRQARAMGLPHGNALVVSAPKADPAALRDALARATPDVVHIGLLRKIIVVRDAGELLPRKQLSTVVHAAASRLGMPYVWGATGPKSFDCSGLMQWSFAQAGVHLPRVAAQQFFAGPHVKLSDARPGALLFYRYDPTDPNYIDHVTMYLGDGKMIVAPHTGTVVQVEPVRTAHLAGVVRVDPKASAQVGWS
jgi:cell wall-associated NlpC family hydrolase